MSDKKDYVGNAKAIKTQYGEMLKISFGPKDLEMLNQIAAQNKGWVNLDCGQRKEVSDKGFTHSIWIDTWKPDTTQAREGLNQPQTTPTMNDYDDDLAF
jgi:hypothetical protein